MKYLKVFQTESDYNTAKDSLEYPTVSYVEGGEVYYTLQPLATPLYFEALADGMTVRLTNRGYDFDATDNELEYSTDLSTWSVLPMNTTSPSINTGERIYLRGNVTSTADLENAIMGMGFFKITQQCNVGGNIMSLLFNDDFEDKTDLNGYVGAFYRVFSEQPIVDASELILPATTLADMCYYDMFRDCASLTTTPALPATTLEYGCYGNMFYGCTSLTTAPELPATTLAVNCYMGMFLGCTSLTTAPALPVTTLTDYCYNQMFEGCTSLTTAPALPATTLAESCYSNMFYGCTSLTATPALPATTLSSWCYSQMFFDCTNLNYIKMLATDISASDCLYNWVSGVSATGTFVKNASLSEGTIGRGENGIPEGWTVVDAE